jgi:hypothetical protein
MKQLELTDTEKAQAGKLAKMATAAPPDDFWRGVQDEANRLHKAKGPEIKPRQIKS